MSDALLLIRSNISFHDLLSYDHEMTSNDPLWHSCWLQDHFIKNCPAVATPIGSSTLNKNTAQTKANTYNAKPYHACSVNITVQIVTYQK